MGFNLGETASHNWGFTDDMPIAILALYRVVMKKMANRSMQMAVAIKMENGVYKFSFVDKKGIERYSMVFLRGIKNSSQIIRAKKTAMLPYTVESREELISLRDKIDICLTGIEVPKTLKERVERFLQLRI